jgi:hypothetical protein
MGEPAPGRPQCERTELVARRQETGPLARALARVSGVPRNAKATDFLWAGS